MEEKKIEPQEKFAKEFVDKHLDMSIEQNLVELAKSMNVYKGNVPTFHSAILQYKYAKSSSRTSIRAVWVALITLVITIILNYSNIWNLLRNIGKLFAGR